LEKQYAQARLQFQQGLFNEPLKAADAGYKNSGPYPDLNWRFRILAAESYIRLDQNVQSLDILQPEPPASLPQDVLFRRRLIQAYTHCYMNEYDLADHYFQQAETIQQQNGLNEADLDYFRGRCEQSRAVIAKADEYLHKALNAVAPDNLALKVLIFQTLGRLANADLRSEEAIDWCTQSVAAARGLHAPLLEEQALGERGKGYLDLYDLANAEKDTKEALDIASRIKMVSDEQKWLLNVGVIQQDRGQYGNAEEIYKRALALSIDLKDTRNIALCLDNLTIVKLAEGDIKSAGQYHAQNASLTLSRDLLQKWKLTDVRIDWRRGDYATAIQKLKDLLQQMDDDIRSGKKISYRFKWDVESYLARTYTAMGDPANAEKWFREGIDTIDQATAQNKKHGTTIRDNIPIYDAYVELLVHQNQPEKALQVAQLGRARTLLSESKAATKESPQSWVAGIQHTIRGKNIVLFSYYATEKNCYLWVITPIKMQIFTLGVSTSDIASQIASYRSEIQNHLSIGSSPASKRLFQMLVQPAQALVPGGTHVMILADSSIYSVNFETLISSESGDHYWIDDVDVQYANSIDLLLQPNRASPSRGLLLIGAPAQADPKYPPLPHAPQEMDSVYKHFAKSDVTQFRGKDAIPETYTQGTPGRFKYIHFATHGTANIIEPLQSAIILSADPEKKFKLSAEDIIDPKLRLNADLVTISACEGAGTQVQSLEGLLGLEWAFMRAGARQIVAALWDVDDTVTPGLMDDFYDGLKKGETTAEALRHAKLKILHSNSYYSAPYYWAPLQVYTRS
jgi:CHAT domain-containing protein/Tfp pilus assembly protein PilF